MAREIPGLNQLLNILSQKQAREASDARFQQQMAMQQQQNDYRNRPQAPKNSPIDQYREGLVKAYNLAVKDTPFGEQKPTLEEFELQNGDYYKQFYGIPVPQKQIPTWGSTEFTNLLSYDLSSGTTDEVMSTALANKYPDKTKEEINNIIASTREASKTREQKAKEQRAADLEASDRLLLSDIIKNPFKASEWGGNVEKPNLFGNALDAVLTPQTSPTIDTSPRGSARGLPSSGEQPINGTDRNFIQALTEELNNNGQVISGANQNVPRADSGPRADNSSVLPNFLQALSTELATQDQASGVDLQTDRSPTFRNTSKDLIGLINGDPATLEKLTVRSGGVPFSEFRPDASELERNLAYFMYGGKSPEQVSRQLFGDRSQYNTGVDVSPIGQNNSRGPLADTSGLQGFLGELINPQDTYQGRNGDILNKILNINPTTKPVGGVRVNPDNQDLIYGNANKTYTEQRPTIPTSPQGGVRDVHGPAPVTYTEPRPTAQGQAQQQAGTATPQSNITIQNLPTKVKEHEPIILEAANKHGVDPALVAAIITQESGGDSTAVSRKTKYGTAKGAMQLIDSTAAELGVKDQFDATQNINGGTKYIKQLLDRFNGNIDLALAAYNSGPTRVAKLGRVPNIKETKDYVKKVTAYYNSYSGR